MWHAPPGEPRSPTLAAHFCILLTVIRLDELFLSTLLEHLLLLIAMYKNYGHCSAVDAYYKLVLTIPPQQSMLLYLWVAPKANLLKNYILAMFITEYYWSD